MAAGLLTTGPAAFADPADAASATGQAGQAGKAGQGPGVITLDGVAPGPKTITLITGDKVTLTSAGTSSGAYSVKVDAAPRPDGHIPAFEGTGDDDASYLYPDDALPAVESGVLDKDLFNLTYLAENGYTDADTKSLPVIAQYPKSRSMRALASSAEALPASEPEVELSSIHATGLEVSKTNAPDFWSAITPAKTGPGLRSQALPTGISKLWLDHKVSVSLDESVPMIGAPDAWDVGLDGSGVTVAVLDSGYDEKHPDLAGKVVAEQGFAPFPDVTHDGYGHGTHVASTIAGSGAASDGRYKGVAPGVDLMIGKVLNDNGQGLATWIIAGMGWAANNGADIISMSLGGTASSGDDLMSQAINDLSESTGALFVIAAGNSGPRTSSLGTPGIAEAALTVAAVDKSDQLAGFSSRGPRRDGALKPDIAAPGVNITAARAAGTSLCLNACIQPGDGPVNAFYASASGTSMATPHVAGAAAILAQQHPDWTAAELKAALMSTSKDDGYTAYEQGAGRVDVARAVDQTVFATTPNADFGNVPGNAGPATRQVTYRNTGDHDVTLTLTPSLRQVSGEPAPDGALSADGTVTVPAGGTATATLTLDVGDLAVARYSGAIVATDEATGTQLRTPVGLFRQPPMHTLTVNVIGRDGQPGFADLMMPVDLTHGLGGFGAFGRWVSAGVFQTRVPEGKINVSAAYRWIDENRRDNIGWLLDPEVEVSGDTEITLDARDLEQFRFNTSRPAEVPANGGGVEVGWQRKVANVANPWGSTIGAYFVQVWVTPTEPVKVGDLTAYAAMPLAAPEVTMRVWDAPDLDLHPMYYSHDGTDFRGYTGELFTGTQTLPLVNAGLGQPEDIAGRDLTGKLALLEMDSGCGVPIDRLHNLRDAGATGVLAWPSGEINTSGCSGGPTIPLPVTTTPNDRDRDIGVPYASIAPDEARALRDRLTQDTVQITVTGTPESPYVYEATPFEFGQVPDSLTYDLTDRHVARVDAEYHPPVSVLSPPQWAVYPDTDVLDIFATVHPPLVNPPATRTHYVGPLSDRIIHWDTWFTQQTAALYTVNVFDKPVRIHTTWNGAAAVPGSTTYSDVIANMGDPEAPWTSHPNFNICAMCREGDEFYPVFHRVFGERVTVTSPFVAPTLTHLYQGDREIPLNPEQDDPFYIPSFTMPSEPGNYRLTLHDPGTRTESEWTFHSQGTANEANLANGLRCPTSRTADTIACRPEPLVYATYDLGSRLGLDNKVSASGAHWFTVNAYHAPSRARMPAIAGLRLWYSQDDGKTWKAAQVKNNGNGQFEVKAVYAPEGRTGAVSLKLEAWDEAGNTLTQTTTRAFELRYQNFDPIERKSQ